MTITGIHKHLFFYALCTIAALLLCSKPLLAQRKGLKAAYTMFYPVKKHSIKANDSTLLQLLFKPGACKQSAFTIQTHSLSYALPYKAPWTINAFNNSSPLPVNGNITYDFFYRSAVDTPYTDNNIQQHSVRATINVLVAQRLPVSLQINTRQTNSYLFKNYTDVNCQFNGVAYKTALKEQLTQKITTQIKATAPDSLLYKFLQQQQQIQNALRQWLEDGKQLQQLAESRQVLARVKDMANQKKDIIADSLQSEQIVLNTTINNKLSFIPDTKKLSGFGFNKNTIGKSINQSVENDLAYQQQRLSDSLHNRKEQQQAVAFLKKYEAQKEAYEKTVEKLQQLQEQYKTAKENTRKKIEAAKETLSTNNTALINKKIKEYRLDSTQAFKMYKQLSAIRQLSIGRSMVDYSELSAKNISLTGLQVEYNNKYYVALATGSVDYRYRDFMIRGYNPIKQYLNLLRIGMGNREKNNLIFTVYQGKKQAGFFASNDKAAVNKIFGVTAESTFRLNENNYIIAEVAKSSHPQAIPGNRIDSSGNKTFNFANHSNEAYSLQLYAAIPATDTRFFGQYKHVGRNFQSFNIFNVNSDFTGWQARADQYIFKKQLVVTASIRNNDYINPYVTNNYKSNTVFKSVQATFRKRKWPVLSVGYMPAAQLTSFNNQVIENRFYSLTASANYMYHIRGRYMHTGVMYTKFYNDAPDASFVYYNARNWFITHNIIGNTLSFNSTVALSYNTNYNLLTLDQGINYKLNNLLSAGGGVKLNRLNNKENNFGYYGNLQMQLKKIGSVQLSYNRGFIPGTTNQLRKNDFGRATYIKTF